MITEYIFGAAKHSACLVNGSICISRKMIMKYLPENIHLKSIKMSFLVQEISFSQMW